MKKTPCLIAAALAALLLASVAANTPAFSQAGSTGGTVGKADKSISGATEPEHPVGPHEGKPQKARQRRREAPDTHPSDRSTASKAPDVTTRCPLPEGSIMSAVETQGCALKQGVTTYAQCVRYGHAHGYTEAQIDTYCTLLPR